ncbi:MAG: M48 family metallopeptidase [Solirubrobacteraceae bacterium]|jgi:Zn-dependent protease with chaperone function
MTAAALPEDQRLRNISSKAYEHPSDRAATAALQSIPGMDGIVRKLIEFGYERALRQQFLAGSVKLGEDQLATTWADWNAVCARLDLPETYDLYLTQFPMTNAAAIGSKKPMVVINSRCVDLFDEMEMRTVLGHEAGHILSDHVLYRTALMILLRLGISSFPFVATIPLMAVQLALLEWFRCAELSCDRAATLVNRDPLITCRTMMVLAGGTSARKLNLDAFIRQAGDYEDWDSGWDKINRLTNEIWLTHSYPVRRVKEIMRWVQSGEYDRIVAGQYPTRDQQADARKEAGDAVEFYKQRFAKIIRDTGANEKVSGAANKAGETVADAADKLADWIRKNKPE